jgi:hypothetical protein
MNSRERWTVYPLLLLAIGLAVRGNVTISSRMPAVAAGAVTADTVFCKELAIVSDDGQIVVHAGRVKDGGGGRIEIFDSEGNDAIAIGTSAESRDGSVEFFDADGNRVGRLGPQTVNREEIP